MQHSKAGKTDDNPPPSEGREAALLDKPEHRADNDQSGQK
jgi:hypothetical protein